jgi:hypothetical protein
MVGGVIFAIFKPRLDPATVLNSKPPSTPTMTQEASQPPSPAPHSTAHESGKPLAIVSPATAAQQQAQTTPVQTAPAVVQPAPLTQLDRLIQTDRNLTPGDRNRLSDALFDYAQFLEQGMALGYKMNTELGNMNNDSSFPRDVDTHIKVLRDIGASGNAYSKAFAQIRDKWKYYPDQTDYIFGDNPDNLGPNALINAAAGFANYLHVWSKATNKDQQDALTLLKIQQNDYNDSLYRYFHWVQGSQQRLNQVKQSIQPNGVVQPIPSGTVAPAAGMFTANRK